MLSLRGTLWTLNIFTALPAVMKTLIFLWHTQPHMPMVIFIIALSAAKSHLMWKRKDNKPINSERKKPRPVIANVMFIAFKEVCFGIYKI